MTDSWTKSSRFFPLVSIVLLAFAVSGCDDGKDGDDGADGVAGSDGINCWDLNGDGVNDPGEDINSDGVFNGEDCTALTPGAYAAEALHTGYFTDHNYEGTQSCLDCHGLIGQDMLTKAHFTWEGTASNITGFEGAIHGKNDLINNFCIAVPTNEGRCTQCHAGYGYGDDTFDFGDPKNIDCLVCHDQSGTYQKAKTTAGMPETDPPVDLNVVARSVAGIGGNGGTPKRKNCIGCHAKAGGGDNVKHGDLAMALVDTTRDFDVHMGTDGGNMPCVDCHRVKKVNNDPDGELIDHGIGGMPYHSTDEGDMQSCVDCHGDRNSNHAGSPMVVNVLNQHPTLACQVCHIPAFARDRSTKVVWNWSDAGQDISPIPVDPTTNPPNLATYDKKKGSFVWARNVRPTLRYFDGKWNRAIIEANDSYDPNVSPVVLGEPSATYQTPGAMIYPFKKMVGNQVADDINNILLVPHLFGMKGGPNPYWAKYDWDLALQDGAAYTNRPYSGSYDFVDTVMYLTVNHEVAPKEQALGNGGECTDCHTNGQFDWTELGYSDDPVSGGTRP